MEQLEDIINPDTICKYYKERVDNEWASDERENWDKLSPFLPLE